MANEKANYHDNTYKSVDTINTIFQLLSRAVEKINYSFLTTIQHDPTSERPISEISPQTIWPIASFLSQVYCICRTMKKGCNHRVRFHRILVETYIPSNKTAFYNWKDEQPENIFSEARSLSINQIAEQVLQAIFAEPNEDLSTNLGKQVAAFKLRNAPSYKISVKDDYMAPTSVTRLASKKKPNTSVSEEEHENLFMFLRFLFFLVTCENSRIFSQLIAIYFKKLASADNLKIIEEADNNIEQTCRAICRMDQISDIFTPNVYSLFEMVFYQSLSNLNSPKVNEEDSQFQEFYRIFTSCGQQLAATLNSADSSDNTENFESLNISDKNKNIPDIPNFPPRKQAAHGRLFS